jgi:hypothetical protein
VLDFVVVVLIIISIVIYIFSKCSNVLVFFAKCRFARLAELSLAFTKFAKKNFVPPKYKNVVRTLEH